MFIFIQKDHLSSLSLADEKHIDNLCKYTNISFYNIRDFYRLNLSNVSFILKNEKIANDLIKPFMKDEYKTFEALIDIKTSRS